MFSKNKLFSYVKDEQVKQKPKDPVAKIIHYWWKSDESLSLPNLPAAIKGSY